MQDSGHWLSLVGRRPQRKRRCRFNYREDRRQRISSSVALHGLGDSSCRENRSDSVSPSFFLFPGTPRIIIPSHESNCTPRNCPARLRFGERIRRGNNQREPASLEGSRVRHLLGKRSLQRMQKLPLLRTLRKRRRDVRRLQMMTGHR